MAVSLLQMSGNGVVDQTLNTLFQKIGLQRVAIVSLNYVEMENMISSINGSLHNFLQPGAVPRCNCTTARIPIRYEGELSAKDCRLNFIKATVNPNYVVMIAA